MKKIFCLLSLFIALYGYCEKTTPDWKKLLPMNHWQLSYKPDLEDVFNIAEVCLNRYESYRAAEIYKLILENVPQKELEKFRYDNCSGTFIANAGLCFAASYARWNIKKAMLTNDIYYLHGKQAYEIAVEKPGGCQNVYRFQKLLYALVEIAPAGKEKYIQHTREISNTKKVRIITKQVESIWLEFIRGNAKEAAASFNVIFDGNPQFHISVYKKAGLVSLELEDYRSAVKYWFAGLKLMWQRYLYGAPREQIREIKNILPLLTTEEIEEFLEITRKIAARNPALAKNVSKIAEWMNVANDEQIQFELKLRGLENAQSDEYKAMLKEGIKKYKYPVYAEKLGDYNLSAELQCKRIQNCNEKFRLRYYMKRFEHIIDKIDNESLKKYRDVLKAKEETLKSKNAGNLIDEMKLKIKEFSRRLTQNPTTDESSFGGLSAQIDEDSKYFCDFRCAILSCTGVV